MKKPISIILSLIVLLTTVLPANGAVPIPSNKTTPHRGEGAGASYNTNLSIAKAAAMPPEYATFLSPPDEPISLAIRGQLTPPDYVQGVESQSSGPYRTTVTIRNVEDLKRLSPMVMSIVDATEDSATVVVDGFQLRQLAAEQFFPHSTDLISNLHSAKGPRLSPSPTGAEVTASSSTDSDDDGLSDIEEGWWCTDPLNSNSDGDAQGYKDGYEVDILLDVTIPRQTRYGYGPPFGDPNPWPRWNQPGGCNDGDLDTIPSFAEEFVVGTDPLAETTDRDKFDDGQELFGTTFCTPGAPNCSYGNFPRAEDKDYFTNKMPGWVLPPGDSPFVAAFPVPEISVVPGSWNVERVTTITTQHGVITETQRTYQTTATRGQSTSIANTKTWNEWEEVSEAVSRPLGSPNAPARVARPNGPQVAFLLPAAYYAVRIFGPRIVASQVGRNAIGFVAKKAGMVLANKTVKEFAVGVAGNAAYDVLKGVFTGKENKNQYDVNINQYNSVNQNISNVSTSVNASVALNQTFGLQSPSGSMEGVQYAISQQGELLARGLQDVAYAISQPRITETKTNGRSQGGAQTNTNEEYEEHAVSNGQGFTTGENWSTSYAVDSSRAALLRFTYNIINDGTDLAREVDGLVFNIYIGEDMLPSIAYKAWQHFPNGILRNLQPGSVVTLPSNAIELTLDQMRRIDEGEKLTIIVSTYSYGSDQLFYEDARKAGVTIQIEDGVHDGNEDIDTFIMATRGPDDNVQRLLQRYFPIGTDAQGYMNSIWTPEFNGLNPPTWVEHYLSDSSWWNVYTTATDDRELRYMPARAGSALLFRFNTDTDHDGYSDRAELLAEPVTDESDPTDHPEPQILAGYVITQTSNVVTATLAVENTGTFDASGIEAIMYAPDDSITVLNNTVGGNGRVRPGSHVALGSLIDVPRYTNWPESAPRVYATGNYTGNRDRLFTFTVSTGGGVGQGSTALTWMDDEGNSGVVPFGSGGTGYLSPLPRDVIHGLQLGINTGNLQPGWSFTVAAFSPLDTFVYKINRQPFTKPVVVVSYSDPQGSHRFITPVELSSLDAPLAPQFSGAMMPGGELQASATSVLKTGGSNTTNFIVNNPVASTIQNAHLYISFIVSGTVAAQMPYTVTLPPGPSVIPVTWSPTAFAPAYTPGVEGLMLAFLTDGQDTIIDSTARPLATLEDDPDASAIMPAATWNFGTAQQGTLLQHSVTLANTGRSDLLAFSDVPSELSVSAPRNARLEPADMQTYELVLDTTALPAGPYSRTLSLRTNDPAGTIRTVQIQGTLTAGTSDTPPGSTQRPLDWDTSVAGSHNAYEWIQYTHTLGPNPVSLHPVKVYSYDYSKVWGAGKYATAHTSGTSSSDMFGDGRDGVMPASGNLDYDKGVGVGTVSGTQGSTAVSVVDHHGIWRVNPGDMVLIHAPRVHGVNNWELNRAAGDFTGTGSFTLQKALSSSYSSAQIMRVPQYTDCPVSGTVTPLIPWNGAVGGILAFMCNGQTTITGSLDATGRGFRGGPRGEKSGDENQANGMDGEGYPRASARLTNNNKANGNGGGPGDYYGGGVQSACNNGGGGGGGGGNGSSGGRGGDIPNGSNSGGIGGGEAGNATLSNAAFGGGGGGGSGGGPDGCGNYGFNAANGGGLVFVSARNLNLSGTILANGNKGDGTDSGHAWDEGAGGSGAGGSILLRGGNVFVGNGLVRALGGPAVIKQNGAPNNGGAGGVGRIRIEHCEGFSGSTEPAANREKLNCYMAEQVESAPFTTTRLNLPESFSDGRSYQTQYGRRLLYGAAGEQVTVLRLPASAFTSATLDALLSDVGSGSRTLRVDIGNDNSWDWERTLTVNNAAPVDSPDLSAAFSAYWAASGAPTTGTLDVPVKVSLNSAGQVLLTNLKVASTGSKLRHVRLAAQTYVTSTLGLFIDTNASNAGPLTIAADIGDNGTVDWSWSGSTSYPSRLTTGNLASAINAYLSGRSGDVDVPVRFYLTPALSLNLAGVKTMLAGQVDLSLAANDINFSNTSPTEGDVVTASALLRNNGTQASGGLTVGFYADIPGYGLLYIGSTYMPGIAAGATALASVPWNTSGYIGSVPVLVAVDPYDRVVESVGNNNAATRAITVRTRADIIPALIGIERSDRIVGEPVNATIVMSNTGETSAPESAVRVEMRGERGDYQVLNVSAGTIAPAGIRSLNASLIPAQFGTHVITVTSDLNNDVSESVETNNVLTRTVYIGVGAVGIDAGAVGESAYTSTLGYGYLNGSPHDFGGGTITSTVRLNGTVPVQYRIDGLQQRRFYHMDILFYQTGAAYTQTVQFDGIDSGKVIPVLSGAPSTVSILVPAAAYTDTSTIVSFKRAGSGPAVVSWLRMVPIEYIYIDSGGPGDTLYSATQGYGYLGNTFESNLGGSDPVSTYRSAFGNQVLYRFDQLDVGKEYMVDLTLYGGADSSLSQSVFIDGIATTNCTSLHVNVVQKVQCPIDLAHYSTDGSVQVGVMCDGSGCNAPFVNEIALEEMTLGLEIPDTTPTTTPTTTSTAISTSTPTALTMATGTATPISSSIPSVTAVHSHTPTTTGIPKVTDTPPVATSTPSATGTATGVTTNSPTVVPTGTSTSVPSSIPSANATNTRSATPTSTMQPPATEVTSTRTPLPTASSTGSTSTITPNAGTPTVTATACLIEFSDVEAGPPSHPFYSYVRCLACLGVLSGYSDGTFRPGNNVTRGQIAKIVSNAADLNAGVTGQTFEDVPPSDRADGSPFYMWIERLTGAGHMSGYACQDLQSNPDTDIPCVVPANRPYFRPMADATRAQLAKIVSNASRFTEEHTAEQQIFADVNPDDTFYQYIQRLASRDVMGGYGCIADPATPEQCDERNRPYFRPGLNVTRGQTAKIVAGAFFPRCAQP